MIELNGKRLGFVDDAGNIRREDDQRIVGHVGNDRDQAVRVLHERYLQYAEQTHEWITETQTSENRLWRIADVDRRISDVSKQYVLGDLQEVSDELQVFKEHLVLEQNDRIQERQHIIDDARLLSDSSEWKQTATDFEDLNSRFKAIGSVGDRSADQAQWDGFKLLERVFRDRRRKHFDAVEAEFVAKAAEKEALCLEAEELQHASDIKAASAEFRRMMDTWKAIGFSGRDRDDALWARFNAARDAFNVRRSAWMADNAASKESLVQQAEVLLEQDDAVNAQRQMKQLMGAWRSHGSAGKDTDDALWQRFRAAQQQAYQRSQQEFESRQQEREQNYTRREALVAEAEALLTQNSREATRRCKEIQAQWKQIGPVPREKGDAQWNRFRVACDAIFRLAQAEHKRRTEGARDHAVEQIRKLSAEIDEHERKIEHWEHIIATLREGAQAEEIRENMTARIATAKERIAVKLTWIEQHHARMGEVQGRH